MHQKRYFFKKTLVNSLHNIEEDAKPVKFDISYRPLKFLTYLRSTRCARSGQNYTADRIGYDRTLNTFKHLPINSECSRPMTYVVLSIRVFAAPTNSAQVYLKVITRVLKHKLLSHCRYCQQETPSSSDGWGSRFEVDKLVSQQQAVFRKWKKSLNNCMFSAIKQIQSLPRTENTAENSTCYRLRSQILTPRRRTPIHV